MTERCAYCHDTSWGAQAPVRCPGCATFLHVECVEALLERCPTLGCRRRLDSRSTCGVADRPLGFVGRGALWVVSTLARALEAP